MSHFLTLVLTESGSDAEVEHLLAPYDENGEWFADGSRWDWWVVGGRWTGWLGNYDPREDPRNMQQCEICHGTMERPGGRERFGDDWYVWCDGCNGCMGKGKRLKHAAEWVAHDGDRVPVSALRPDVWPYPPST